MRKLMMLAPALAASLLGFAAAKAPAPFALGEKVTFFGDSITTHNYFTYQLEFIDALRHGDQGMETISRGVAGDTARGGFTRWDWDAAPVKSDRVFMMFGMNDIGRGAWKDEKPSPGFVALRKKALDTYAEYSRKLSDKILASGRKLVLLTPSPYDQYSKLPTENIPYCNDPGLASCAKIIRELAAEKELELVDLHQPMTRFLQEHEEFGLLKKDRVHPDGKGGLLMAVMILEQMGVLPYVDETAFDAKGKSAATFAYTPKHLPYPRSADYLAVNAAYKLDGRLIREMVKIANLPAGEYELSGDDGKVFARFSSEQLAKGVDLAVYDTPSMAQAKRANNVFSSRRGSIQRNRRLVTIEKKLREKGVNPQDEAAVRALIAEWRASVEKRFPKKDGLYNYYKGQVDFCEANFWKKEQMWAESDALLVKLRERVKPAKWSLKVERRN